MSTCENEVVLLQMAKIATAHKVEAIPRNEAPLPQLQGAMNATGMAFAKFSFC
jgi:hypothetical protein